MGIKVFCEGAGVPKPVGAYSPAVVSGETVYISGQIAINPETEDFIGGDIEQQAKQVLKNLTSVLAASGSGWNRVLMTTIFLAEITDSKVVNELYGEVVSDHKPARQTVAVKSLPLGAKVEISLIASR